MLVLFEMQLWCETYISVYAIDFGDHQFDIHAVWGG